MSSELGPKAVISMSIFAWILWAALVVYVIIGAIVSHFKK